MLCDTGLVSKFDSRTHTESGREVRDVKHLPTIGTINSFPAREDADTKNDQT